MKAKIFVYALLALFLGTVHLAEAQQAAKVPRIGFLSFRADPNSPYIEAFRLGLRDLGYIERQNIEIEYRCAEGNLDLLRDLPAELVRRRVEVIVAGDSVTISFAAQATRSIPIVMTVTNDPVRLGYIDSLPRPGGNITGLSNVSVDLAAKRLELLKEVVPKLSRVAVLGPPFHPDWTEFVNAAATMGIKLQTLIEGVCEIAKEG